MDPSHQLPPQPSSIARLAAQSGHVWSQGFIVVMALIALLGGIVSFLGVAAMPGPGFSGVDFTPGNRAEVALDAGLVVVCLVVLGYSRSWLLRAGLLLQVGATAVAIITVFLSLQVITITPLIPTFVWIGLLSSALNLPSLICLSYGLARWHPSDRLFLPMQLLLTLGLGIFLVSKLNSNDSAYAQVAAGLFCDIASVMVVLARPACWKAGPLIVLWLTIGTLVAQLYYVLVIGPSPTLDTALPFQLFYGLNLGATLLFILGVLLLAQTVLLDRTRRPQPALQLPQANQDADYRSHQ